jgi:hypothetical protein
MLAVQGIHTDTQHQPQAQNKQRPHAEKGTYASIEGEIRKRAMRQQASFVLGYAIADLRARVDCRGGALEGRGLIKQGDGIGIPDPVEKLVVGYDPDCVGT